MAKETTSLATLQTDWQARAEKAEAEVIEKVRRLVEAEERAWKAEEALQRLQTPADDRRLAEIRALKFAGPIAKAYLFAEIDRLRGTLASYADARTVERKAEVSNDKH